MSYVPIIPASPSPQARELSARISAAIDEFRRHSPGTTSADIRQALRLAGTASGADDVQRKLLVIMGLGLLMLGIFVVLRAGDAKGDSERWMTLGTVGVVAIIGCLAVLVKRRS